MVLLTISDETDMLDPIAAVAIAMVAGTSVLPVFIQNAQLLMQVRGLRQFPDPPLA